MKGLARTLAHCFWGTQLVLQSQGLFFTTNGQVSQQCQEIQPGWILVRACAIMIQGRIMLFCCCLFSTPKNRPQPVLTHLVQHVLCQICIILFTPPFSVCFPRSNLYTWFQLCDTRHDHHDRIKHTRCALSVLVQGKGGQPAAHLHSQG